MHSPADVYAYILAHGAAIAGFLALVLPTIITGLTEYPKAATLVGLLKLLLNIASVVSHKDSPGTFKAPLTMSKAPGEDAPTQPPRGYARLLILVALAFGCLFSFAAHAAAEAPGVIPVLPQVAQSDPQPDPAPSPSQFGGCTASGRICFSPSIAISIAAINLSSQKVEGAFSPGAGYGFTVNPGKWSSVGLDAYFIMSPAANQASGSILAKFFNGYLRIGVSKGFLGDKSTRILFGPGIDIH